MLSRKADKFTLASRDTGHGQLLSAAISWANKINFSFGAKQSHMSCTAKISCTMYTIYTPVLTIQWALWIMVSVNINILDKCNTT